MGDKHKGGVAEPPKLVVTNIDKDDEKYRVEVDKDVVSRIRNVFSKEPIAFFVPGDDGIDDGFTMDKLHEKLPNGGSCKVRFGDKTAKTDKTDKGILGRFIAQLTHTRITNPDPNVIATIARQFSSRLQVVCDDMDLSLELYDDAKLVPTSTTRVIVAAQSGLIINGPLRDDFASILTAVRADGVPVIVKVLSSPHAQQEIAAVVALNQSHPPPSIIQSDIVSIDIPSSDARAIRGRPGEFKALIMPRFLCNLADFPKLEPKLIYTHIEAIIEAIDYIHSLGYVHMDVKSANIFIAHDGHWVLGDFGSMVKQGDVITSCTELFYPDKLRVNVDIARCAIDWEMLLVCVMIEITKENWRSLLSEHTHRVDRAAINVAITTVQHDELRSLCLTLKERCS